MPEIPLAVPAWTAGVLLAAYVLWVVRGLTATPREHDPQRGQATGCLTIVAAGLLALGAVLAAGVYWHFTWLVWAVFCVVVYPLVSLAGGTVRHVTRKIRGRR